MTEHAEGDKLVVRNETARQIIITEHGKLRLVLPPLDQCTLSKAEYDSLGLEAWKEANVIAVRPHEPQARQGDRIVQAAAALVPLGAIVFLVVAGIVTDEYPEANPWIWVIGLPILAVLGLILGAAYFWISAQGMELVKRSLAQTLTLLVILVIGFGFPASAIYFFGEGNNLLTQSPSLTLLGRFLQLFLIVVASLLPALLFFLFDRQEIGTLRARFHHEILRLDPYLQTLRDVNAKYGKDIQEVYGPEDGSSTARLLSGTRWPILVATAVITVGWILTLLPVDDAEVADEASDLLTVFLAPERTPLTFAFLGAYFFAISTILRRYTRADLQPKAYSSITVRIIIVVILAWLAEALFVDVSDEYLLGFAFFAGMFPEAALTVARELLSKKPWGFPDEIPLREKHPLTNLDGIELYDRARLMDEGITNVQGLAYHDLVKLMLQTRMPTARLVDWVDQAILYLRMGSSDRHAYRVLREQGIRTASDLDMLGKSSNLAHVQKALDEAIKEDGKNRTPCSLKVVIDAIYHDEWMDFIRQWHRSERLEEHALTSPGQLYGAEPSSGGGQP